MKTGWDWSVVFAAAKDIVVKADDSEAVCEAAGLAGSSVAAVYLPHKHWRNFTLAD